VEETINDPYCLNAEQPLCSVSYECDDTLRAYVEPFAVGDRLESMPIYLLPDELSKCLWKGRTSPLGRLFLRIGKQSFRDSGAICQMELRTIHSVAGSPLTTRSTVMMQ